MKTLWAISDLHVHYRSNREALEGLGASGRTAKDWLILAGDIGNTPEELQDVFELFAPRFEKLLWVPGNHELWGNLQDPPRPGPEHYQDLVAMARHFGVQTPEDPILLFPGPELSHPVVLLFLLYDYSFTPPSICPEEAKAWALEERIRCADETWIDPAPYPDLPAWCRARLEVSQETLEEARALRAGPAVLVNHWPLRYDLARVPKIPRFTPWCGTRASQGYPQSLATEVVVSGHLHVRATDYRHGVRYEEVALGYPRHWRPERGLEAYLRPILPGPSAPPWPQGPELHR